MQNNSTIERSIKHKVYSGTSKAGGGGGKLYKIMFKCHGIKFVTYLVVKTARTIDMMM